MSVDVKNFVTWIRSFLDDVYAPKGSGGSVTLNDVYPIGSIYMSVNSTSPSTLFGGTWVQLTDTFLYASDTADANSTTSTDGEETHTLTVGEMPSHNHTQNQHRHLVGGKEWSTGTGNESARINTSNRTAGYKYTDYQTPIINNNGGGQAHNNMPPYMRVFMWKRTN